MASLSTDDALQSRIVAIEKALHLGLKGEATSQLTSCVEAIEGALKALKLGDEGGPSREESLEGKKAEALFEALDMPTQQI